MMLKNAKTTNGIVSMEFVAVSLLARLRAIASTHLDSLEQTKIPLNREVLGTAYRPPAFQ